MSKLIRADAWLDTWNDSCSNFRCSITLSEVSRIVDRETVASPVSTHHMERRLLDEPLDIVHGWDRGRARTKTSLCLREERVA